MAVIWSALFADSEILRWLSAQLAFIPAVGKLDFLSPRLTAPVSLAWALSPLNAWAAFMALRQRREYYLTKWQKNPSATPGLAVIALMLAIVAWFIIPVTPPECSGLCINVGSLRFVVWCLGISHLFGAALSALLFWIANIRTILRRMP